MRGLNVEHCGIDEIGNSKLPKHGGPPRGDAPLDLEIADIHRGLAFDSSAQTLAVRRRTQRKGAPLS
jgi:hypothetical protein